MKNNLRRKYFDLRLQWFPPQWPLGFIALGPVVGQNQKSVVERAAHLMLSKAKSTCKGLETARTLQDCALSDILCPNGPTSTVSADAL